MDTCSQPVPYYTWCPSLTKASWRSKCTRQPFGKRPIFMAWIWHVWSRQQSNKNCSSLFVTRSAWLSVWQRRLKENLTLNFANWMSWWLSIGISSTKSQKLPSCTGTCFTSMRSLKAQKSHSRCIRVLSTHQRTGTQRDFSLRSQSALTEHRR